MRLIEVIRILIQDRKRGSEGRNDRVQRINELLGLEKRFTTAIKDTGKNKYVVDYKRSQFWYDDKPITLKAIVENFGWWHVQIWKVLGESGSMCGFVSGMIKSRFGRRKIYKWLDDQSRVYDRILTD